MLSIGDVEKIMDETADAVAYQNVSHNITGPSISHWLPCPVPFWVPNVIGTWGGNSVKFS